MNWKISLSKDAEKFLERNQFTQEEIDGLVKRAIYYFQGDWRSRIIIFKLDSAF